MKIEWHNADFAHGPTLAQWCVEQGLCDHRLRPSFCRAVVYWSQRRNPSVWTVDKWMTECGYTLGELPENVWRRAPEGISEGIAAGKPIKVLARELGVSPSTIRYWRERVEVAS